MVFIGSGSFGLANQVLLYFQNKKTLENRTEDVLGKVLTIDNEDLLQALWANQGLPTRWLNIQEINRLGMSNVRKYSALSDPGTSPSRQKFKHDDVYLFQVHDRYRFDKDFPLFRQPIEIGFFSVNIDREFQDDSSQLKYFVEPVESQVSFDLKKGYKDMIRKDESVKTFINPVLSWILKHLAKFASSKGPPDDSSLHRRNLNTDFVCWRGLLTKLLCTPYENREDWIMAVTLFNGTYYLCEFDTESKVQREQTKTEKHDVICCGGWKFEQYLTADTPNGKPDTDSTYNNIEGFCTVVRSRLNQHSLVFAGEVDAICKKPGARPFYVEMKTTGEVTHPKQVVSMKRFKYIKWWAQSFLVGIPEIICGYRNDDMVVTKLEKLQTRKIPDLVKDIHNPWKPNVCFNFLDELLSFIKRRVTTDDHRIVHLITWTPGKEIKCRKLPPDSEFHFLPDWYTNT